MRELHVCFYSLISHSENASVTVVFFTRTNYVEAECVKLKTHIKLYIRNVEDVSSFDIDV